MLLRGIIKTDQEDAHYTSNRILEKQGNTLSIDDDIIQLKKLKTNSKDSKVVPRSTTDDEKFKGYHLDSKNIYTMMNKTTPVEITCHFCNKEIKTEIKRKRNRKQCCYCTVLCLCLLPVCALLPFCISTCYDNLHYCPNCTRYLGKA